VARTLASIGLVQAAQARLAEARKTYEEALALLEAVGEKQGIARVHNFIGSLNLYEGRSADAQKLLRQAAMEFQALKAADEQAATLAVLAKALLTEGKNQDAEKTIHDALRLVEPTSNRQWRLEVGIAAARVEAATGKRAAAATRLRKLRDDAKGFLGVELDAELALGEVEIASGQAAQGRARLESVEKQARTKGFLLLANQAASARR
jgi:tetratricopeptide (TPR) repeat protein